MASFMAEPAPTGPQCSTLRQSCSRIGRARSASAGSAPIRPSNCPLRAGAVEPPTGHSTTAAPLARTFGAKSGLDLGRHRAHLDEQLALDVARQQAVRAGVDLVDRLAVGEDGDDRFAGGGDRGRRADHLGAGLAQGLGLVRRAIPHRDLMADLDQTRGDGGAHGAETGYSDFHAFSPYGCWRQR